MSTSRSHRPVSSRIPKEPVEISTGSSHLVSEGGVEPDGFVRRTRSFGILSTKSRSVRPHYPLLDGGRAPGGAPIFSWCLDSTRRVQSPECTMAEGLLDTTFAVVDRSLPIHRHRDPVVEFVELPLCFR